MTPVFTCLGCGSTLPLTYQSTGAECVWCATGEGPIVARPAVVRAGGINRFDGEVRYGGSFVYVGPDGVERAVPAEVITAPTATPGAQR